MFSAPIPGQSLTSEPKNYPWENPPLINTPEEALIWHMDKLQDDKAIEAVAGLLALGLDVVTMTEGILRNAVADGVHSIDVSLLIGPIIHQYIKGIGDLTDIDYNEGFDEKEEGDLDSVVMTLREREIEKILEDVKYEVDLSSLEESELPMEEEEPMDNVKPQEEKPAGLMSRRTV
jgi:hypothetical protein